MAALRKSQFGQHLYDYIESGGILVGESAGAIVLTGNIGTASFPEFDRDENDIQLMDWRGLDLISFEFFPHYQNRPKYSRALRQYTRNNQNSALLACSDGSGIVITEDQVKLCGEVFLFCAGKKFLLGESL
jgi:dipeptidase E